MDGPLSSPKIGIATAAGAPTPARSQGAALALGHKQTCALQQNGLYFEPWIAWSPRLRRLHRSCARKPRRSGRGGSAPSLWLRTYSAIIESGAPPHEAAKYDGDHSTPLLYRPDTSGRISRSRRLDTPLRLFTSPEMRIFGG
jgi:hypothetical protein